MRAHRLSSWTWRRLLAPALAMLGLAACHEVAVVELPAQGTGRTALWLVSRTEAVSGGQLVCPAPAEEETPELDPCLEVIAQAHDRDEPPALKVFARRGDVSVAYVELACSLDVLGLTAGPQELAAEPLEPRRVPRALSGQVWSSARLRWVEADTTDGWIDAALTRIRFAESLKCRLRHAELTLLPLAQRVVRSLSTTPDGRVLAVAVGGVGDPGRRRDHPVRDADQHLQRAPCWARGSSSRRRCCDCSTIVACTTRATSSEESWRGRSRGPRRRRGVS
jgi:hypothetical protein